MTGEAVAKNVIDRTFTDVRDRTPWTVHAEVSVDGRLDERRLVAAAGDTLRQHPMLDARHGAGQLWDLGSGDGSPAFELRPAGSGVRWPTSATTC